jgi:hypothetical protein
MLDLLVPGVGEQAVVALQAVQAVLGAAEQLVALMV